MASSAETLTAGRLRRRPAVRRLGRKWLRIALYIGPAALLYVVFVIAPVVQAVHYSLYSWSGLGPLTDFIGLDNYGSVFGDPAFRQAMTHNAILVALSLAIQLPLALGRSEEHTSELQSLRHLVCRLLLEKKKKKQH